MCGRYDIHGQIRDIEERFGVKFVKGSNWRPSYNAAPSQLWPIITHEDNKTVTLAKWGFYPEWARRKPTLKPQINARVEGIGDKPYFRDAYQGRHCIIPANGFYEWQRKGTKKRPYYFSLNSGDMFAFAGIYARGEDDGLSRAAKVAICTRRLKKNESDAM
jgi:putative SOS response-associated peptidase YedK